MLKHKLKAKEMEMEMEKEKAMEMAMVGTQPSRESTKSRIWVLPWDLS